MYNSNDNDGGGVSPREVSNNMYILCHYLAQHDVDFAA